MKGQTRKQNREAQFQIPWDITEWIDRATLLDGIEADIGSLDWNNALLKEFLRANPAFRPRLLLVLMTYSYSMGICESEEILGLYYKDTRLQQLFPEPPLSANVITRFRRENRGLLRWAVNQVMKRALRIHLSLGEAPIPAGLKRALLDAAGARIDVGRQLDRTLDVE